MLATSDEVQSLHVFSKETNKKLCCDMCSQNQSIINCAVLHFCPSPKEHVYMQVSALGESSFNMTRQGGGMKILKLEA